ncbi:MAG: hypothetical protein GY803_11015 [Chloroflexi bacterium]|nr:hypothetical protein [Chloroflexota bacterium]
MDRYEVFPILIKADKRDFAIVRRWLFLNMAMLPLLSLTMIIPMLDELGSPPVLLTLFAAFYNIGLCLMIARILKQSKDYNVAIHYASHMRYAIPIMLAIAVSTWDAWNWSTLISNRSQIMQVLMGIVLALGAVKMQNTWVSEGRRGWLTSIIKNLNNYQLQCLVECIAILFEWPDTEKTLVKHKTYQQRTEYLIGYIMYHPYSIEGVIATMPNTLAKGNLPPDKYLEGIISDHMPDTPMTEKRH